MNSLPSLLLRWYSVLLSVWHDYCKKHLKAGESIVENSSRRPRQIRWLSWTMIVIVLMITLMTMTMAMLTLIMIKFEVKMMLMVREFMTLMTLMMTPVYQCTISRVQNFLDLLSCLNPRSIGPGIKIVYTMITITVTTKLKGYLLWKESNCHNGGHEREKAGMGGGKIQTHTHTTLQCRPYHHHPMVAFWQGMNQNRLLLFWNLLLPLFMRLPSPTTMMRIRRSKLISILLGLK